MRPWAVLRVGAGRQQLHGKAKTYPGCQPPLLFSVGSRRGPILCHSVLAAVPKGLYMRWGELFPTTKQAVLQAECPLVQLKSGTVYRVAVEPMG